MVKLADVFIGVVVLHQQVRLAFDAHLGKSDHFRFSTRVRDQLGHIDGRLVSAFHSTDFKVVTIHANQLLVDEVFLKVFRVRPQGSVIDQGNNIRDVRTSVLAPKVKRIKMLKELMTGFVLAACLWSSNAVSAEQPPNVIVILADDLGLGDIGAYRELYDGKEEDGKSQAHRFTPNLDRLAKNGIRFTRAYACSWCAPSRQVLLSGQWANRASAYDHPWLGNQMRKAGYVTGFVGKSHGALPTKRVFRALKPKIAEFDDGLFFNGGAREYYLRAGETFPGRKGFTPFTFTAKGDEHLTDVFTDHAVDFIRRATTANTPFMLYLPYTAPHEPLQGKPEDLKKLFPETFAGISDDEIRASSKQKGNTEFRNCHYAAMVYGMDRGIGRLMQTLREEGVADNTVVLFSSDNGGHHGSNYPLTGHKWDDLEGGIRVPFIIWSDSIAKSDRSGSIYDGLVSLADIAPTVMAQATTEPYALPTDGLDLMPYVTGEMSAPKGRRFFWANAAYEKHLTGIEGFHEKTPNSRMMQSVLIRDHEKVICWNPIGTDQVGAVYSKFPDIAGTKAPAKTLWEATPVAGKVTEDADGKTILRELVEMVRSSEGELVPDWSGATAKELSNYQWWMSK